MMIRNLRDVSEGHRFYIPDWWQFENYYIQVIVEKIDLKTLFEGVCSEYHIPIATSKGWSSMLQRAAYAKRFKEAEDRGLKCVLLYAGDYDPDGLRISDFLRKNLEDLKEVVWGDGEDGYNPKDLIIDRFGLNKDLIEELGLTWIDNLETGSEGYFAEVVDGQIVQGRTKQGKPHPNFYMDYMQEYLEENGVRKCEGNAIIPHPVAARNWIREVIEGYLGKDALDRFEERRKAVEDEYERHLKETGLDLSQMRKFLEDE
jgi:hypothetical protein